MGHSSHQDAEGNNIPSVSQIPGIFAKDMDGFEDWICKGLHGKEDLCCTKAKRSYYEEAANLGNDIHSLREAFLKGERFEDGVPEFQASIFEPVAKFYKESGYKPLFVEEKMTGASFGGTLDGCGTFSVPFWEKQRKTFWDKRTREALEKGIVKLPTSKDLFLEDLKVKSKLDILHPLQLLGYSKLLLECKNVVCDYGLIIRREKRIDKTPEIQLRGYYLPLYEPEWQASLMMWRFLND